MKATLAIIAGDGIGQEVVPQGEKVLQAVAQRFGHEFELRPVAMGYNTWKSTGTALSDESIEFCRRSHGILHGATGPADWEYTEKNFPPGWGKRQLCREMGHRVSVRPAKVFPPTMNTSPTKSEVLLGTDLIVVRDFQLINRLGLAVTGSDDAGRWARDTLEYFEADVALALKFAYLLARSRRKKLCLMTQSSIFATSRLWLQVFEEMSREFSDIEVEVNAPDNCAMQLMRNPSVYDVIVTDSTPMGGMMNNLAALLIGSIGMAPGTTIGLRDGNSFTEMVEKNGMYEPIHGSAPRRAGQNLVNPIGTVLAAAMLLRFSLGLEAEAAAVEKAVEDTLAKGYRTYDIMESGKTKVGTSEMGDRIVETLLAA